MKLFYGECKTLSEAADFVALKTQLENWRVMCHPFQVKTGHWDFLLYRME